MDGTTAEIGQKADPATARIEIDGKLLPVRPDSVYYLIYKPTGVISTRADDRGRRSVVDLVPAEPPVYPVGRLDADSEGLLILTNDGDLTHLVTHPRFGVTKTYTALTTGKLSPAQVKNLEQGVELDDGPAKALSAKLIDVGDRGSLIEVVMGEGRNREVRRMVTAIGAEVTRLVRTAIGPIRDQRLKPGEWRPLSSREVWDLCRSAEAAPAGIDPWDNGPGQSSTHPER